VKIWLYGALLFMMSTFVASQPSPVAVEDEPHHHLVLKNDSVMVVRVKLLPGESTLFHTHLYDRVTVDLTDTTITRQKFGDPKSVTEATKPGDVAALESHGPFTHLVHNAGNTPFEALDVEVLHRTVKAEVAAAAKVEAENPSARVYKWILAPGATSAMHTHERPYLIISATPLMLKMTDPEGKSFTHEVKAGDIHWVDAKVTHSLANEGAASGTIVEIELK